MSITPQILGTMLIETLKSVDIEVEKVISELEHHSDYPDYVMHIVSPHGQRRLAIEMMRQAYPRDVRDAAWHLQSFMRDNAETSDIILMIAAEHISEGAKAELRKHGLAYFEASGTLYLRHKEWLIDIQRRSKPIARRGTLALFTGAREQVILTLLVEHRNFRSGLELAEMSMTSTYSVSTVLTELERREWIESEGSGRTLRRRLCKPAELLDAWAEEWTRRKETKTKWHFYAPSPGHLLDQLSRNTDTSAPGTVVFTGAAAANRIVPHLTRTDTIDIIVPPGEAGYFAEALGMKSVDKGANVTFIERSGVSRLFTKKDTASRALLANPFILYLDLLNGKGRNKELAEQLRLQELGI
ncbi:type IV toxin-antitoxin system AbiEi family antitoxin [Janthinobacterium rivuli]|uniref:type IV toxin-antitoxin system AbiEi family antitoxin n=1 Tax=Janthinobacterium rivuli TaxID=2751478 RepID=UPI00383A6390